MPVTRTGTSTSPAPKQPPARARPFTPGKLVQGASVAEAPHPPPSGGAFAVLRRPAFRYIWAASFLSNVGNWMEAVAQSWLGEPQTAPAFLGGVPPPPPFLPGPVPPLPGGGPPPPPRPPP